MTLPQTVPEDDEVELAALMRRPELYLDHMDLRRERAVLLAIPPAAFDPQCGDCFTARKAATAVYTVPIAALVAACDGLPPAEPHFVFMTDWCGSTLLGRALAALTGATVFHEPEVFMRLAADRRTADRDRRPSPLWPAALACATRLMTRGFHPGPVVIKEQPLTNYILADLLAPGAHGVFLYGPLDEYLAAALSNPHRVRYARLRVRGYHELATSPLFAGVDLANLDAARTVAVHWLHQIDLYRAARGLTGTRLRPLASRAFFAAPKAALRELAAFFGLPTTEADLDRVLAGPVFTTHAKDPARAFSLADRQRATAAALDRTRDVIAATVRWAAPFTSALAATTDLLDLDAG